MIYSDVYYGRADAPEDLKEDMYALIGMYGEDFCFNFIKNYLTLEERNEWS
tara:strand:- start:1092 stop:1244 length:153 start_codon:yes stop_codon:yes gene_type:complete